MLALKAFRNSIFLEVRSQKIKISIEYQTPANVVVVVKCFCLDTMKSRVSPQEIEYCEGSVLPGGINRLESVNKVVGT